MFVSITATPTLANARLEFLTDNSNPPTTSVVQNTGTVVSALFNTTCMVLPGNYYKAAISVATATLFGWFEWT